MPTYQYACTECGHAFEQFQSFSDDALTECPECQGRLRKVFNAVGVVFKGSGFYRNDSREQRSRRAASGVRRASPRRPSRSSKSETQAGTSPSDTKSDDDSSETKSDTSSARRSRQGCRASA